MGGICVAVAVRVTRRGRGPNRAMRRQAQGSDGGDAPGPAGRPPPMTPLLPQPASRCHPPLPPPLPSLPFVRFLVGAEAPYRAIARYRRKGAATWGPAEASFEKTGRRGGAGRGGARGAGPVSGGEAGVVGGGEAVIDALDGDIRVGGDVLHAVEEVARHLEDDEAPAAARGGVCVCGVESCGGQGEGRWGIPPRPAPLALPLTSWQRGLCAPPRLLCVPSLFCRNLWQRRAAPFRPAAPKTIRRLITWTREATQVPDDSFKPNSNSLVG